MPCPSNTFGSHGGDDMTTILDFFKKYESEFWQRSSYHIYRTEEILKDAQFRALAKLKILCGADERIMLEVLHLVVAVPAAVRLHKWENKSKRKTEQKIHDKKTKLQKKIAKTPLINSDDKEILSLKIKRDRKVLDALVKEYEVDKTEICCMGKTNPYFKDIIHKTFLISKEHSGLKDSRICTEIANLLNYLKFKTPQGRAFTKQNIEHYCK
jgi:hypothetical protein